MKAEGEDEEEGLISQKVANQPEERRNQSAFLSQTLLLSNPSLFFLSLLCSPPISRPPLFFSVFLLCLQPSLPFSLQTSFTSIPGWYRLRRGGFIGILGWMRRCGWMLRSAPAAAPGEADAGSALQFFPYST